MNSPQEFLSLLPALRALEARDFAGGAALATLIGTHGSTFRRPGARFLVLGDGSMIGNLSGGCPERDVALRAASVIETDHAVVARYSGASVFDPMLETGCGGEIEVLIEPITHSGQLRFVDAVSTAIETRSDGFMATILALNGEPLAQPRRLVIGADRRFENLEEFSLSTALVEHARRIGDASKVERAVIEGSEGRFDVFFERLRPPPALFLLGSGAVSRALARHAECLGWWTTLVDDLAERPSDLPESIRFVACGPDDFSALIENEVDVAVGAATHHLARDVAYLCSLRDRSIDYIGAIGSRARAARLRTATGLSARVLHAPAGLDLGGETPEEIALAVASEILGVLARRNPNETATRSPAEAAPPTRQRAAPLTTRAVGGSFR